MEVEAVQNCKLPRFWKDLPELWFLQVESIFLSNRVQSDKTRYHLLITFLKPEVLVEVADVLKTPPETNKYENLKAQILARFADSSDRRLQRLLNELELGDRKPLQLLRQMRSLADGKISDDVLRIKWLALLPLGVQRVLKIFKATSIEELETAADELMESPSTPGVLAVAARSIIPSQLEIALPGPAAVSACPDATVAEMRNLGTILTQLVALNRDLLNQFQSLLTQLINRNHGNSSNDRNNNNSRSRSRSPAGSRGTRLCHFHWKFGALVQKCQPPCSFRPSTQPCQQQQRQPTQQGN